MNIEKLPVNVPKYLKKAIYFYDVVYTNKNIFRNFIINANNLFKNKTRIKILLLLEKESLNITELSKKVGLSYKVALQHINILRAYGLVKESRKLFSQGREVILSTKGIDFQKNIHIAITNKKESLIQECYKKLKSIWKSITLEQVSIIFNSVQPWVVDVGQDYATVTPKELKENATP